MRQQVALHGKDNRIGGVDPIPPGRWEYAGTANPLLHGWGNAGGGLQEFRWRRTNENETEIQGFIYGGTANPVINLPDPYRPGEIQHAVGSDSAGHVIIWELEPSGNLNLYTTTSAVTGTEITDAGGIIYDFENVGGYLDVKAGDNGGSAGYGINLETTGVTSSDGIRIYSAYDVSIYAAGSTARFEGQDLMDLVVNDSDGPMYLTTNQGDIQIQDGVGSYLLSQGSHTFELEAGATVRFLDSGSNQIMRLDEDGTLHLLSGASIVYDL